MGGPLPCPHRILVICPSFSLVLAFLWGRWHLPFQNTGPSASLTLFPPPGLPSAPPYSKFCLWSSTSLQSDAELAALRILLLTLRQRKGHWLIPCMAEEFFIHPFLAHVSHFCLIFLSKSFIILGLILRSQIHFELIFLYGIR